MRSGLVGGKPHGRLVFDSISEIPLLGIHKSLVNHPPGSGLISNATQIVWQRGHMGGPRKKSATGAGKPNGYAGLGDGDTFGFQHGFGKPPHLVISRCVSLSLRVGEFKSYGLPGTVVSPGLKKFPLSLRMMMGRNFCFWPSRGSPMGTMTSCRSNAYPSEKPRLVSGVRI